MGFIYRFYVLNNAAAQFHVWHTGLVGTPFFQISQRKFVKQPITWLRECWFEVITQGIIIQINNN